MVKPHRPLRVLFVCLGNICRSPLAEGIFSHLIREAGVEDLFEVDSAGTGAWHVGEAPDPRATATAATRGITLEGRGRQVEVADFSHFDYILAMDAQNLSDLETLRGETGAGAALSLLRDFDPEPDPDLSVPDPYYGGPSGFEEVFRIVHRSCAALLQQLQGDMSDRS